jgi:hypothetical protein
MGEVALVAVLAGAGCEERLAGAVLFHLDGLTLNGRCKEGGVNTLFWRLFCCSADFEGSAYVVAVLASPDDSARCMFTSIASLRTGLSKQSGVNRGISSCAVNNSTQFLDFLKCTPSGVLKRDVTLFHIQTTPDTI